MLFDIVLHSPDTSSSGLYQTLQKSRYKKFNTENIPFNTLSPSTLLVYIIIINEEILL